MRGNGETEEVGQGEYAMRWWRERQSKGGKNGERERALNSEAIIKWNMERALEGTFESALCILMECETAWKPLY